MAAAGFIVSGQQLQVVDLSGELLLDEFARTGAQVGGDGEAEIGGQQIVGDEPQPAEVVAFGARFVEQQVRARGHSADLFWSSQSLAYFKNV